MQLLKIEKRKGISPLIATLLLIAIAVAASVLTYSWVMSMIGSQSAQAQTQLRIDGVNWAADSVVRLGILVVSMLCLSLLWLGKTRQVPHGPPTTARNSRVYLYLPA